MEWAEKPSDTVPLTGNSGGYKSIWPCIYFREEVPEKACEPSPEWPKCRMQKLTEK